MSFLDGIGDEVINFVAIVVASWILYFAWRSTNVRDERIPRNLIIIESNRRRLLGRVAQNPITISILHSTSQQSNAANEADEYTEEESLAADDTATPNPEHSLHIQEAPSLEAIFDEVTTGNGFVHSNREQEQLEIIREMDRDESDGIRHRRTAAHERSPVDAVSSAADDDERNGAPTTSTNRHNASPVATDASSLRNRRDSADSSTNTENCTNENSENGSVIESLPYAMPEPVLASGSPVVTSAKPEAAVESKGIEFRIKLKYLSDEVKLVKGCPNEFIGDFKKRNFTDELSGQKIVRLVFNGHVLQPDTKTLKACGLFDNCVVHCLVHNPRPFSNLATNSGNIINETDDNNIDNGNANPASINAGQRLVFLGMFLICLTLLFCWYFRIQYYYLFSWYSTTGLILLTCLFLIIIPLLYLIERQTIT